MVTSNLHIWHMHIYERLESAAVWIQYDEMIFYVNLQFHVVIIGYGATKKFTSILYSMRISHRLISNLSLLNAEKKETFMEDSHEYAEMSKITNTLLTCTFYLLANYRSGAQRTSTTITILIRCFTLINCYDFFFFNAIILKDDWIEPREISRNETKLSVLSNYLSFFFLVLWWTTQTYAQWQSYDYTFFNFVKTLYKYMAS